MATVRCRCGKTKKVRRHGEHFTCPECRQERAQRRARYRAATTALHSLVAQCRCGPRQFPEYATRAERELEQADAEFHYYKDQGHWPPADWYQT